MLDRNLWDNAFQPIWDELGIPESFNDATDEQLEQLEDKLKTLTFGTYIQGNATLTDINWEDWVFAFSCDDGSTIYYDDTFSGLRPDLPASMRYIVWETTRDKLPVRDSQDDDSGEYIKTKSVNVGPSLKVSWETTDPATETVYCILDNETGEIMDPLEVHKLTNVIYKIDITFNTYCPYYFQYGAENISEWISPYLDTATNTPTLFVRKIIGNYDYTLTLKKDAMVQMAFMN